MQLLVVPKSIPNTFAIVFYFLPSPYWGNAKELAESVPMAKMRRKSQLGGTSATL
jgi:hypothetical protein